MQPLVVRHSIIVHLSLENRELVSTIVVCKEHTTDKYRTMHFFRCLVIKPYGAKSEHHLIAYNKYSTNAEHSRGVDPEDAMHSYLVVLPVSNQKK